MAEKSRGPQHGARSKLSKENRAKTTVNEQLKDFEEGERVLIKVNPSVQESRPHMRFHGQTGEVTGMQGESYEVTIQDGKQSKKLYIPAVHLKETGE
ncbi:MAG: large subunit ribosomal protein L21e [Candidatus Nanohaloarchaea archaeon]|jgi:large subunit ribosomal protein L21e